MAVVRHRHQVGEVNPQRVALEHLGNKKQVAVLHDTGFIPDEFRQVVGVRPSAQSQRPVVSTVIVGAHIAHINLLAEQVQNEIADVCEHENGSLDGFAGWK